MKTLINEKKYAGRYVAMRSFSDSTVLACGNDPKKVVTLAKKKGAAEPVVVYIPQAGTLNIY